MARKNVHAVSLQSFWVGNVEVSARINPAPETTKKNVHAVALGRKGGKVGGRSTSPAKQAAARLNGRKGGRPVKP